MLICVQVFSIDLELAMLCKCCDKLSKYEMQRNIALLYSECTEDIHIQVDVLIYIANSRAVCLLPSIIVISCSMKFYSNTVNKLFCSSQFTLISLPLLLLSLILPYVKTWLVSRREKCLMQT